MPRARETSARRILCFPLQVQRFRHRTGARLIIS